MAALDQKWQQKKNSFGQDKKKLTEMTAEERQLQDFREQAEQMRKSQKHANIDAKLAAGEELTPEEIEYLRQNNPQALKDYEDTQRERENYKRALRNCRTKEEVERLKYTKMGQFMAEAKKISSNACIPKGKKVALLKRILQQATAVEDEHIFEDKPLRKSSYGRGSKRGGKSRKRTAGSGNHRSRRNGKYRRSKGYRCGRCRGNQEL